MSAGSALPRASTRPTEERSGDSIDVHVAECPFCDREGTVSITIQLCHGCGRWFEAVPAKEAGDG